MTIPQLEEQLAGAKKHMEVTLEASRHTDNLQELLTAFEAVASAQRALAAAKGVEYAIPHEIGFVPEAAVSEPVLLRSHSSSADDFDDTPHRRARKLRCVFERKAFRNRARTSLSMNGILNRRCNRSAAKVRQQLLRFACSSNVEIAHHRHLRSLLIGRKLSMSPPERIRRLARSRIRACRD
jgi:hypothetical protein